MLFFLPCIANRFDKWHHLYFPAVSICIQYECTHHKSGCRCWCLQVHAFLRSTTRAVVFGYLSICTVYLSVASGNNLHHWSPPSKTVLNWSMDNGSYFTMRTGILYRHLVPVRLFHASLIPFHKTGCYTVPLHIHPYQNSSTAFNFCFTRCP